MGVQGDVAIRAKLADRNVEPVSRADLDDCVDRQVQELALAQAGSSEELHREADERVGVVASGRSRSNSLRFRGCTTRSALALCASSKTTSRAGSLMGAYNFYSLDNLKPLRRVFP